MNKYFYVLHSISRKSFLHWKFFLCSKVSVEKVFRIEKLFLCSTLVEKAFHIEKLFLCSTVSIENAFCLKLKCYNRKNKVSHLDQNTLVCQRKISIFSDSESDCKHNFKWPSMQCPIHNDTLETFIWSIMWYWCWHVFRGLQALNSIMFSCSRNARVPLTKPQLEKINFKNYKNLYLIHTLIRQWLLRVPLYIGIAIFAWRVTWNNAYSPVNNCVNMFSWILSILKLQHK